MTIALWHRLPLASVLLLGAAIGQAATVPAAAQGLTGTPPVPNMSQAIPAAGMPARHIIGLRPSRYRPGPVAAGSMEPVVVAATGSIAIERGQGALIRLPHAAATLFVADPDVADFQTQSSELVYVFGKTMGETVLYAVDGRGAVLFASKLRVTPNLGAMREALSRHLPNDAILVEAVVGSVTLSGQALSAGHIADALAIAAPFVDEKKGEKIVNLMTLAAPSQVNLRVRIAEVDRNILKQIGVNWDAVANAGRFSFGLVTQNPVVFSDIFSRNTLGVNFGNTSSMIDALAQEGFITLLAQPNLTALSGETASFLAGGEFPVPVASTPGTGAPTISIAFKKFGVSLDFTPTVIDGNRINLRVRPEVSQLSTSSGIQMQGFSVPGITVRRAETTVELGSGETFVIAGLLQRTSENTLSKVPGLGDIPIIGALLRSSRYKRNETELAIIVTPYLVKPVSDPASVAAPTDGIVEPSDMQRVLGGQFYQKQPAGSAPAKEPQP